MVNIFFYVKISCTNETHKKSTYRISAYICSNISKMIVPLNLPQAKLKLTREQGQLHVWCVVRKKKLVLTPEEWVRQHVIHFLISEKNVPLGLIASELSIQIHQLNRRSDVVVFGTDQHPKLVVECKAPEIALTDKTMHQIAHYNLKLNVDYLWITNGIQHGIFKINRSENTLEQLAELPTFETFARQPI